MGDWRCGPMSARAPRPSVRHFVAGAASILLVIVAAGCTPPTAPTPTPTPTPTAAPVPVPDPPNVTCPPSISQTSTSPAGTPIVFADPAVVGGQAPVAIACTPSSGSTFLTGSTTVECRATDALNRTASCVLSVTVVPAPRLSRTRFMAFGDSITEGEVTQPLNRLAPADAGLPSFGLIVVPSASYPTILGKLLVARYSDQVAQIGIENQGESGERAREAVPRFLQVFNATRPEVLLLMEGYNDIGTGENGAASGAASALSTMASEARNRGTRVFLATLAPSRPSPGSIPPPLLEDFNRRVRAVAAGEGAVLVDIYGALLNEVNTYVGVDGVHLTEAGYRKVAETFFAAIRATLEVP